MSLLEITDWWEDLRFWSNDDFHTGHIAFSVIMVIILIPIIVWHFAEAWRILPGAYYISGQVPVKVIIETNLHRIYNVSRGLILAFALLYAAFAYDEKEGWELHYVLLAWVFSLLAQFKARPSVAFLAVCSGVFAQGVGAYGVNFLCNANKTVPN